MKYELLSRHNLPHATALAKELHNLGRYGVLGPPFDWDFVYAGLAYSLDDPNSYVRLAVDDDGIYVGGVRGHVSPFTFSPALLGIEDCWYVREGTPKRAAVAMNLMHEFMSWCMKEKGAVHVQTGDVAAIHSHAVDTLYRHMGFRRFGTIYVYLGDE